MKDKMEKLNIWQEFSSPYKNSLMGWMRLLDSPWQDNVIIEKEKTKSEIVSNYDRGLNSQLRLHIKHDEVFTIISNLWSKNKFKHNVS